MITHVAVIYNGRLYCLPGPSRHHHVIHQIALETGDFGVVGQQGFLTDDGVFLDLAAALSHAEACDQVPARGPTDDDWLYSEDLW